MTTPDEKGVDERGCMLIGQWGGGGRTVADDVAVRGRERVEALRWEIKIQKGIAGAPVRQGCTSMTLSLFAS
jgi:hypothetical protein